MPRPLTSGELRNIAGVLDQELLDYDKRYKSKRKPKRYYVLLILRARVLEQLPTWRGPAPDVGDVVKMLAEAEDTDEIT